MSATPKIQDITIVGPFWSAKATVVGVSYSGDPDKPEWTLHARTLFVDRSPQTIDAPDTDSGDVYVPGTLLALCFVRSVLIQPDDSIAYRWKRADDEPPDTATPDQIRAALASGELALLLLQMDPQIPENSDEVAFTCINGDICLDVLTPRDNALDGLYQALDLEAATAPERWTASAHSSGLSIYGRAWFPWESDQIAAPFQLARLLGETPGFRLTIEADRLTHAERLNLIKSWRKLSGYLNPWHPLNDLPLDKPQAPAPTWVTLELANPLDVPDLYWQIAPWAAVPGHLPLHFSDRAVNLLFSDQQPYDTENQPTSLAQVTLDCITVSGSDDGGLTIVVQAGQPDDSTQGTPNYQWDAGQERFTFTALEVAFSPVKTPEILRHSQSLPVPQWFPGEEAKPIEPDVVWGFMPLEEGWAQLPIPNLTEQIYLDAGLTDLSQEPASRPLLQGAISIGNDNAAVLAAHCNEQPWNVTLVNGQALAGTWKLQPDPEFDLKLARIELAIAAPELILNGLFWLSTGRSTVEDALPDLSDWLSGLQSIPLRTVREDALFPPPVTFAMDELAFSLRTQASDGTSEVLSALLTGWVFTYQAKQDLLQRLITEKKVLAPDLFSRHLPLIWKRHQVLPMIQALPLTQSKSPPNYPNASRQYAPFELPVDSAAIAGPTNWRFGVSGENGAASWPHLLGDAAPAREWTSALDLPLASLSLPGIVLDPATSPDATGLRLDPGTNLPVQYRFDLPYSDQINALAQLPKEPREPAVATPLPEAPPPEPPKPLVRETLGKHWQELSVRASLASADAIEAFGKQDGQSFILHLIEPFRWPVQPDIDLTVYPGTVHLSDDNGAALDLRGEDALRGISGRYVLEAGGSLSYLADGGNGDTAYMIEAGSMAAYRTEQGAFRDQRGLLRWASVVSESLLRTRLTLERALAPSGTGQAVQSETWDLVSALQAFPLHVTGERQWSLWFRDLPVASETARFDRALTQSPEAEDINDPEALSREYNHLAGYEWRLGEAGQTGAALSLFNLQFYPLTLEQVVFDGDTIQTVEMIGRLQLPLRDTGELEDLSNAVRLSFGRSTASGDLELTAIALASDLGEWPLALQGGEATDAPRLVWRQIRLKDNQIEISDLQLKYFLFEVEWSLKLEPLILADGAPATISRIYADFDVSEAAPVYPKQVHLELDLDPATLQHSVTATLVVQLGRRAVDGLVARYTFREGSDPKTVYDVSGVGDPLNLVIDGTDFTWLPEGGLAVTKELLIQSSDPATKIATAMQATNEISIEAWVKPANTTQDGPARIVSLSADTGHRNFTLGQGHRQPSDVYDVRLRTTSTDDNGRPSLTTAPGTLTADLTHVVYTRDVWGERCIYLNGELKASGSIAGDFHNWDTDFRLAMANELTKDRPWLGEFHLVALYDRAMAAGEVKQSFDAGVNAIPRSAFTTEVEFGLITESGVVSVNWNSGFLFDDIVLSDTDGDVVYTTNALQFNWRSYTSEMRLQLLPGMDVYAAGSSAPAGSVQPDEIPGFAFLTFDVIDTFTLDASFAQALDANQIPASLRLAFECNGHRLAADAEITASGGDSTPRQWVIRSRRHEFTVKALADRLAVYASIPGLNLSAGFVEALITVRWGEFLQDSGTPSVSHVFGSSAGDLVFGYTACWQDRTDSWDESFLLNGFLEVKNLISWPQALDYQSDENQLTLPAARGDEGVTLAHTRHTVRVMFNQHEVPPGHLVAAAGDLIFNLANGKPWQFLAVVEHQLIDVVLDGDLASVSAANDRRWTTLQEVRLMLPETYKVFLDQQDQIGLYDPILRRGVFPADGDQEAPPITIVLADRDDAVNEDPDGQEFRSGKNVVWIGNGRDNSDGYTGLRFVDVGLPRGARVVSARLEVFVSQSAYEQTRKLGSAGSEPVTLEIAGDAVDNSAAFSDTNRPSQRARTDSLVSVTVSEPWEQKTWYTIADIAPIIQEIIDRPDWQPGNSLSVILCGPASPQRIARFFSGYTGKGTRAPRLVITLAVPQLTTFGYLDPRLRASLAGSEDPALKHLGRDTLLVEASAPHWIKQVPVLAASPTALQYLPNGSQLGILSNPQDYGPSEPGDPKWLLLAMPFLGRLQNSASDGLDGEIADLGRLQIDPVVRIHGERTAGGTLSPVALAFANWSDAVPAEFVVSNFDSMAGRTWPRLDPISLEENWFKLQNPLPETAPTGLQSVTAALSATPAQLSRSTALRHAFDTFRRLYPPGLTPDYELPGPVTGPDIVWRQNNLLVIQGAISSGEQAAPYSWHLIGLLIASSALAECDASDTVRRYAAATLMPALLDLTREHNRAPVCFAVSPYLGLEFKTGTIVQTRLISAELLCLDRVTRTLLPVASHLFELQPDQTAEDIQTSSIIWARETHLRLSPDSPVAVLRFREINEAETAGGEPLLTTTYAYALVKDIALPQKLSRRVLRIRTPVDYLRFRQGQFGGNEIPANVAAFELAPPQTTGVQPIYLNKDHGLAGAPWRWGLSTLRLSVQVTQDKQGVIGSSDGDTLTLWWQAAQHSVQFRSALHTDRPTGGLPPRFRAPAIKSLLPVLPQPPLPAVDAQALSSTEPDASLRWQPVLPGALRTLVTGSRAGAMLAFRSQLMRQSGLTLSDNGNESGAQRGTVMVSGSVPVQHRVPRPVPLPPNSTPDSALQTWASHFEPQRNLLESTSPVDEAFFAACGDEPAHRLQMILVEPASGTIPPGWNGDLVFDIYSESGLVDLTEWTITPSLLGDSTGYEDQDGTRLDVSENRYQFKHKTGTPGINLGAGAIATASARIEHARAAGGFYQTLAFPLRASSATALPLPLEPRFIHFEDPEYNRRLASSSAHVTGNVTVEKLTTSEIELHEVKISADRKEYNPDSAVALRFDWDVNPDPAAGPSKLQLARISSSGNVEPLIDGVDIEPGELQQFSLNELQQDSDIRFIAGDRLRIGVTLEEKVSNVIAIETVSLYLEVDIVTVPVTPVPDAAYALLRSQVVDGQQQVECVRFAWGPEASRIELVCADDLPSEVVRRRAVFHWQDSVRPGRTARYAIQKITRTGSTHFPAWD